MNSFRVSKPRILRSSSTSSSQSSQETLTSSSPPSSPLSTPKSIKKFQQSLLSIGINERKTCHECGMSFLKNLKGDIRQHQKYHNRCLNGRDWSENWGDVITRFNSSEYIVKINPSKQSEVHAALDLLEIVNRDLNAPDDNDFWMKSERGVVYVYVKGKVAVGIVSIIRVKEGRWFSIEDGKVVSDKSVGLLAGISRIYVCSNYRRARIGLKLLQCVQDNVVYGMTVPKLKVGWSQPSFSGGKLAVVYNGVKHKSGKILVPIYLEEPGSIP